MTISATTREQRAATPRANATAARWLRIDALLSGASGFLLAVLAPLLDDLLGAPVAVLVPPGALPPRVRRGPRSPARRGAPRRAVRAVVAGTIWAVASLVVALADLLTLTAAGTVLVLVPACAVALLGELSSSGACPRPSFPAGDRPAGLRGRLVPAEILKRGEVEVPAAEDAADTCSPRGPRRLLAEGGDGRRCGALGNELAPLHQLRDDAAADRCLGHRDGEARSPASADELNVRSPTRLTRRPSAWTCRR